MNQPSDTELFASRRQETLTAVVDASGNPLIKGNSYMLQEVQVQVDGGEQRKGDLDHFYRVFCTIQSGKRDGEAEVDEVEVSYPNGSSGLAEYRSQLEPISEN